MQKIIEAKNLTLSFPIYGQRSKSLRRHVANYATGGRISSFDDVSIVKALDDVNFQWNEKDIVGIMGHNGSGKTSLLRVIAGIYFPTSGSININGSTASMLNINIGVDNDATGLENIYIKCWLMGLKNKDINNKIEDIIDFSELGDFINMPIRTYSSGMLMRLFFAISTCFYRDIIIMDEWLSVGDSSFEKKANERLMNIIDKAKLIVIASHNQKLIDSFCTRKFILEKGRIV